MVREHKITFHDFLIHSYGNLVINDILSTVYQRREIHDTPSNMNIKELVEAYKNKLPNVKIRAFHFRSRKIGSQEKRKSK